MTVKEAQELAVSAVNGNSWCQSRLFAWAHKATPKLTAFDSFGKMINASKQHGYIPTLRGTQEHEALGIAFDAAMAIDGHKNRSWPAKNIV